MASMQTSDIALNAMSVYRVLDENVSEKKIQKNHIDVIEPLEGWAKKA